LYPGICGSWRSRFPGAAIGDAAAGEQEHIFQKAGDVLDKNMYLKQILQPVR
jgi:hypothetical protein